MRPTIEVHKHIHIDAEGRTLRSERPYFVRRPSPRQQEQHQSQQPSQPQSHEQDHSRGRIIQYQYHLTAAALNHIALSVQDLQTLRSTPHRLHKVETDLHELEHKSYDHEQRIRALEKEKQRTARKKEKEREKEIEGSLKRERERVKERKVQRSLGEQGERRARVDYPCAKVWDRDLVVELVRARYQGQIEMLAAVERERRLDERIRYGGRTTRERAYGYASW